MTSTAEAPAPPELFPGYSLDARSYTAPPIAYTPLRRMLVILGAGLAVVVALLAGVSVLVTAPTVRYSCPPDCGRPPTGTPFESNPRFTAEDGSFSVSYPAPSSAYSITTDANGVVAEYHGGDGGVMRLFSEPANGRSAQQVIDDIVNAAHPDATMAYHLPNAMVGYQLGSGGVYDVFPQSATSDFTRTRIVILAAVKNGLALIGGAAGPYHEYGPDYGPGPPSGANLELAQDLGKYVNSFRWRAGEPR
ncbi:MAG: hypothetical protein JST91_27715 [Actinobacteria bacterium]|nr:hypothetical protein [Actinomycetota bacterium]